MQAESNIGSLGVRFSSLRSLGELATFLGVPRARIGFLFYVLPAEKRYKRFSIKKKNGQARIIESPILPIANIQRTIALALLEIYKPRKAVHGFVEKRNIVTNAEAHQGRRWVLNVDLRDFFHSIHFGRVCAIFQGWRFKFPAALATRVAHICCHEGRLPQGAPSSPILSNIATDHLDSDLISLASKNDCTYTRYCDDMTFSTTRKGFPAAIAVVRANGDVVLGGKFRALFQRHRVAINDDKVRLYSRFVRQEVTGPTVNVRPNVTRRYVRQVRAMLHAWETYGLECAAAEFASRWDLRRSRGPRKKPPRYEKVVRGKIEFLGAVRGRRDSLYVKLLRRYALLRPGMKSKVLEMIDAAEKDVFLCHASEDKKDVVYPLAEALKQAGITCFLDEEEIKWGDSVTGKVNAALVQARFVVVVVSKFSIEKTWPQKEMNAALAREIRDGTQRVLPLLVANGQVERNELWRKLALQGDKRYLEWAGDAAPVVANLLEVIRGREKLVT